MVLIQVFSKQGKPQLVVIGGVVGKASRLRRRVREGVFRVVKIVLVFNTCVLVCWLLLKFRSRSIYKITVARSAL